MDILKNIDELLISWGTAPSLADMLDQFIAFALVLIVAFLADVICRNILLKVVAALSFSLLSASMRQSQSYPNVALAS